MTKQAEYAASYVRTASAAREREFLESVRAGIEIIEHAPQAAGQDRRMRFEVKRRIFQQMVERMTFSKQRGLTVTIRTDMLF